MYTINSSDTNTGIGSVGIKNPAYFKTIETNTAVGSVEPVYILARAYSKVILEVILQETTLL